MTTLADVIQGAAGQPASVRIGVVESIDPLVISAQGAPFDNIGLLNSYGPALGDTVALLGQSSDSGSDPASWLALGAVTGATAGRGLSQILTVAATALLSLTGVTTDVPGAVLNFNTARPGAVAVVTWFADFEVTGATITTGVCFLTVNGATSSRQALVEMPVAATAGRWTNGQTEVATFASAGPQQLKLQGVRAGGADGQIRINNAHSTITALIFE